MWTFGTKVESDMDKAEADMDSRTRGKADTAAKTRERQRVLDDYLKLSNEDRPTKGRFADPAARVNRG